MVYNLGPLILLLLLGGLSWLVYHVIYNLYLHPLCTFPGPILAGASSSWRFFIECVFERSFCHMLEDLHSTYGQIVRVGPNELHFANPQAYHDIYNHQNRWDKDYKLYHSFNEDRSSFGFITYKESKERKDVLNKFFSQKAVVQAQDLVVDKINALCGVFERLAKEAKTVDLNWAYRCMAMDITTYLCFGKSVDAIHASNFKAPIIVAMDASLPVFVRFKHSEIYKNMIMGCPPKLSKILSPATAGLVDLQQILGQQIAELTEHPEQLDMLPHKMTIYHQLMDEDSYKNGTVPSAGSLYEEAQALMFAGADTIGATLMVGTYHLLKQADAYKTLVQELGTAWPNLQDPPTLRVLEHLPFLNAVIKESLRMTSGVVSGLLRVVPPQGAKICDTFVPAGTLVSCGSTFVHYNADIFPSPHEFRPERWVQNPGLEQWLVSFSRGPRSCLGINLAWLELRLSFAHFFRRFDMDLDPSSPKQLHFQDAFLPFYTGEHVRATMSPVNA